MQSISLLDVIRSQKWERALFTTYALSLTFFESYLLPSLRKAGCETVDILVDKDGYRASMMERRSLSVGQEYGLIPVSLITGIFHPKCVYLCGESRDVLLVGSGNLTFGGYGKNIEAFDGVDSTKHPGAFVGFSEFLRDLIVRPAISIPKHPRIAEIADRAARYRPEEGDGGVRFLHSLHSSFSDQLVTVAREMKGVRELLVLSPFHHPEGRPIIDLARKIGAKSISIGIPPGAQPSAFPVKSAESWRIGVRYQAPQVEKPKRPLHAKWIEIRGKTTVTCVGSVNATQQSLGSTDNVEAALLRTAGHGTTDSAWKEAKTPRYVPGEMYRASAGELVIFAAQRPNQRIEGSVYGHPKPVGIWQAQIEAGTDLLASAQLEVDDSGAFVWNAPGADLNRNPRGVQIALMRGAEVARGWLQIESMLNMPSQSRRAMHAISRMLNRQDTLDDLRALLDFVAIHANKVLLRTKSQGKREAPREKLPESEERVPLAMLSDPEAWARTHLDALGTAIGGGAHEFEILQRIGNLLLKRPLGRNPGTPVSGAFSAGAEPEDEKDDRDDERAIDALEAFNESLHDALDDDSVSDVDWARLVLIQAAVNLDMLLRRARDVNAAWRYAQDWVRAVAHSKLGPEARTLLDPLFYGLASALAIHTRNVPDNRDRIFGVSLTPQLIHEWVDTYNAGHIDIARVTSLAADWLKHEIAHLLLAEEYPSPVHEGMSLVFSTTTTRDAIRAALYTTSTDGLVGILNQDEIELVKLVQWNRANSAEVTNARFRGCPKCYQAFQKDVELRLKNRRIAQCLNCQTVLFWFGD